jgi:hypothetical protein
VSRGAAILAAAAAAAARSLAAAALGWASEQRGPRRTGVRRRAALWSKNQTKRPV